MSEWLLEPGVLEEMRAARAAGGVPSDEQQAEYEARDRSDSSILVTAGDNAQIKIVGVLTQQPNLFAKWFGGGNTTYGDIIAALVDAEQDPAVAKIELSIDSPGGTIAGLFDTVDVLKSISKPMRAVVHNIGASAAYAIASQADTIEAANRATLVGSVGIVASFIVREDEVTITSTQAPLKRPDVRTPEGVAAVRAGLDDLHDLLVDTIAEGRSISAEKVNADFGRGATVLAKEATRRGMIDGVLGAEQGTAAAESGDQKTEASRMDLKTLKAEHPAVFAEAVAVGVAEERDRVGAHLKLGEASGDMKTATAAILEGTGLTEMVKATYAAANMRRQDTDGRVADDGVAADALDGAAPVKDDAGDADDAKVVALVAANLGLDPEVQS